MKKLLTTLLAISTMFFTYAQDGGIIYTDYEPDLSLIGEAYIIEDTIRIDLDQDGTIDFKMYIHVQYPTMARFVYVTSSWDFRICFNSIYSYGYLDENDSILPYWLWSNAGAAYELLWESYNTHYMELYMGFRKIVDNEDYYAWARIHMFRNPNGEGYHPSHGVYDIVYAYCDDMAYCTIPDYPLHWGQTELSTGVDENNEGIFAVYPNPASNTLTITGESLRQIEITDMLGQRVATYEAEGPQATIDISPLFTGIYFVGITDENGKRCVKKVVKE